MTLAAVARAAAALLERGGEVRPGELRSGKQAEEQAGDERHAEREQHDRRVDPDLVDARQPLGRDGHRAGGSPRRRARGRRRRRRAPRVTISDSSSRAMRPRLAPSAVRTASSCCRPSARTRNRFATFAHAISSTMPTVPSSTHSTRPTSPITSADERAHVRADTGFLEHLAREPRRHREPIDHHRDHPRDVGVRLLDRDAGLEAGEPADS